MGERPQSESRRWWISVLLLLATMLNYMDRQTLATLSVRISQQFSLTQEQYGDIEFIFGVAFAIGALFFGVIADRCSVRWLYPAILALWSAVGFATGFSQGYFSLLVCRGLLGFFEAGHWPCALIVTQRILSQSDRGMGNSILQSGASLGAILTPLCVMQMLRLQDSQEAWRTPFFVIGAFGLVWILLWNWLVRGEDVRSSAQPRPDQMAESVDTADRTPIQHPAKSSSPIQSQPQQQWLLHLLQDKRFWALVVMVICINTAWQVMRAWLQKFLQEGRGYSEDTAFYFNSAYYIASDVGCLAAGAAMLILSRRGLSVHRSRIVTFLVCAGLAALTTVAAHLPAGWLFLAILLVVAAGLLGVFPCYYSLTQELSQRHMGRVTGLLSFAGWMASSPMQKLFGITVDRTGSFDLGIAIAGWTPMVGLLVFLMLWPSEKKTSSE